ncbi:hypothetical protein [Parasphaerochaeta coccoides]|uniref:Uncharacterized protein n=1 Tax=Parasphaerochaeta coccoides (strain ATCC BAA-1237 / DSM 17374 / SPN1) TaxID=760011 RepID=F4GJU6_PARC1|nr:hypothetical protein [Parasphaerochaeta coccoides]AEC01371.1 hypothetical protein Spico_0132 [Parasphaerochaeta coccoides DSM 17374]
MAKKDEVRIQIRNSTTDFLVFTKENGGDGVDVLVADESVWLIPGGIVSLYDSSKSTISEHVTNIFARRELDEDSVVRDFRTTAADDTMCSYKDYNHLAFVAEGEYKKYRVIQDRLFQKAGKPQNRRTSNEPFERTCLSQKGVIIMRKTRRPHP